MAKEEEGSLLTIPTFVGAVLTYWIIATTYNFLAAPTPPTSIPWQGYGKGWIASLRNIVAINKAREWAMEGYEKYTKNNKVFVLPATLGIPSEVVVPPSQMAWMFDQPDSVLSSSEAHYDQLHGEYSFLEPTILRDPYHEHVIHKNLVRNLNSIIPNLDSQVPETVDRVYGMNTEKYQKIDLLDSFMHMIPRLTNHLLGGHTLAHEQKYLDAVLGFTMDVIRNIAILHLIPRAFHPVFGNLLGLTSKYHYWVSSRFSLPIIKQRIEDIKKQDSGDPNYKDWKAPSDFITWSYRTAMAEGRLEEAQPARIAQRILPLNFASIHTTSLTASEALGSIVSSDPSLVKSLREEAYRIHQEEGGWTRQGLNRMHRMDSVIRESQRAAPLALTFIHRKVVAKEGITTPEGIHIKRGTFLSCPWRAVAFDEQIHNDAEKFDAFRYSRPREEYESMPSDEKEKRDALKIMQSGLVTTSPQHLPFGHGRHACPGRFFVSHELKIIFAHILLNYDFEHIPGKPNNAWIGRVQIPTKIMVDFKRRKSPWQPGDSKA